MTHSGLSIIHNLNSWIQAKIHQEVLTRQIKPVAEKILENHNLNQKWHLVKN